MRDVAVTPEPRQQKIWGSVKIQLSDVIYACLSGYLWVKIIKLMCRLMSAVWIFLNVSVKRQVTRTLTLTNDSNSTRTLQFDGESD